MSSTTTCTVTSTTLPAWPTQNAFTQHKVSRPRPEKEAPKDRFEHLPPYRRPTEGVVGYLPDALVPYAELMRLHKPSGYYAFHYPLVFGLLYGAIIARPGFSQLVLNYAALAVLNLFVRGAACTYNDTLDAPLDREVARCRHRPIARGALSTTAGHVFTAVQSSICLWLILATLPASCLLPSALFVATMALYPFCKRFTNYPQVVLGFSLALGQLIGAGSVGLDLIEIRSRQTVLGITFLYLSNVVNTIIYDTVYAHQDLQDDLKAGVHGMAVAVQGYAKLILSGFSVVEIMLLSAAGYCLDLSPGYFIVGVGGTAAYLAIMLSTVRLDVPKDCMKWFSQALHLSGMSLAGGLMLSYLGV